MNNLEDTNDKIEKLKRRFKNTQIIGIYRNPSDNNNTQDIVDDINTGLDYIENTDFSKCKTIRVK